MHLVRSPSSGFISLPVACIEMNSFFYDVWKLKNVSDFEECLDQLCYEACFKPFFSPVISSRGYKLLLYKPF